MAGKNTPYLKISAATTNLTLVKKSGTLALKSIDITNLDNTNAAFVKIYDKATAPVLADDTPVLLYPIAKAASFNIDVDFKFKYGLAFAVTGAVAITDTTAVAAGQVVINLAYTESE